MSTATIPYGHQSISDDDVAAVVAVLRSDFLTQGPVGPRFEAAIAQACGAAHGVAVNSATAALHVACLALDVGPGSLVWTSPNTFLASANCARYCGAGIDFVDIDPHSHNLCPQALRTKLEAARAAGRPLPDVVIPVHFAGQPCEMAAIHALGQEFGFRIIEDASHAIGARFGDSRIGDCRYSDIVVFSFHPVKIITTAEGGMALTQDAKLARRMGRLRSHGMTRDPAEMVAPTHGAWYYEQIELGFNYRMTELQAALGLSQLQRLEPWIERRHRLADTYDRELAALPLQLPQRRADRFSALHLYVVLVDDGAPLDRAALFARMREAGVGVNVHYIPVHLQPDYRRLGFAAGDFPRAEAYYQRAISLPMYAALTDPDQQRVINLLRAALT
ncbi:MAG: UDP-4-amino-4,6-dideoxy-N-acetyl-beta-L-altrosamine transaminase [Burkholderiaceae bacterium]|nr:UDP-4-amino-4,6-dideoxy-N-acetyl-beta-L-altrosamine transaminase [Burkholderiaceae bacterium]